MLTTNRIRIRAGIKAVYLAAADPVAWPRFLSHYRWVRVVEGSRGDPVCFVDMAATRTGFPCSWRSRMELHPAEHRIHYTHVRSTWTRGMEVWWTLRRSGDGTVEVTITHEMPRTFLVAEWFRKLVVGRMFVENIADKTLRGLKLHMERGVS